MKGVSLGEDYLSGPEVNFVFRMEKLAGSLAEELLISHAALAQCGNLWLVEAAGRTRCPALRARGVFTVSSCLAVEFSNAPAFE